MDFPGGPVVDNPPASGGDTGSVPGPGRSHMPGQLCATATEPKCHNGLGSPQLEESATEMKHSQN